MAVNKVRRNGSYAPLSAHYYKDDAIDEAGEAAELLYVRGLAFCADVLSDGLISDRQLVRFVGVGMFDATDRAARLVEVGLWERTDGGYRVRSWLDWNRSREEITEYMAKDRERKPRSKPDSDSDKTEPDPPNGGGQDVDRIPNGNQAESGTVPDRSPNGVQPRVGARAHSPRNSTPLHDTSLQEPLLVVADATPVSDGFDDFWVLYPKKVKKQDAKKSWTTKVTKLKTDPALVLTALRGQIVGWQSGREYPRFVPDPTTWLNGRRWLDEPQAPLAAVSGDGYQPYRNPTDPDAYDGDLI